METVSPNGTAAPDDEGARVAAVRHLYRNQIQAMTSLVGLFGRKLPPGEGRDAFMDLRARFEAAGFAPPDDAAPDPQGRFTLDFAEVARRVAGHLDPEFRHRLKTAGRPVSVTAKQASALAQIVAELVIDLVRNGFADGRAGAAEIAIDPAEDGGFTIRAAQTGPEGAEPRRNRDDLGLAISDSLVRSLGGRISRASEGPLSTEVLIPAQDQRR